MSALTIRAGMVATAAAVATAVGAVTTYLPSPVAALVLGAAFSALVVAVTALRSGASLAPRAPAVDRVAVDQQPELRLARLFFYLGILFVGQLTVRPAFGLTLSDWFFLAALATTLAVLSLADRSFRAPLPALIVFGAILFALGGIASSYVAVDWVESLAVVVRFIYLTLLWFWLAMVLLASVRHVVIAAAMWAVSAAITGAGAILQLVAGDVIPGGDVAHGRMTGFTEHVNDLGGVTAIAIVPAVALAVRVARSRRAIAGATLLLALIAVGLVLSGSVGGLVAACAGLLVWLAVGGFSRRTAVVCGVAAVILVIAVTYQTEVGSPSPLQRVAAVTADSGREEATFWSRVAAFEAAWNSISRSPLIGAGLDEQSTSLREFDQPVHNMLLLQWSSAGLFGIIGLAAILLGILRRALDVTRFGSGSPQFALGTALFSSFIAFVTFGMGVPMTYKRYGWLSAALVLALAHATSPRGSAAPGRRSLQRISTR